MVKETGPVEQQRQPQDTESVDERLAQATPEQVARAIFAAVDPPDSHRRHSRRNGEHEPARTYD